MRSGRSGRLIAACCHRTLPAHVHSIWLHAVSCMQSVLHLQGKPGQHRRADRRHAADPEHT